MPKKRSTTATARRRGHTPSAPPRATRATAAPRAAAAAARDDVLDEASELAAGLTGVVGIGASAGGLEACTQLLDALPDETSLAFVLVQHMSPDHDSFLPQLRSGGLARADEIGPRGRAGTGRQPAIRRVGALTGPLRHRGPSSRSRTRAPA
jgi:hypothetical protein